MPAGLLRGKLGKAKPSRLSVVQSTNSSPVITTIPTLTFTRAVAGSNDLSGFVSDADSDLMTGTVNIGTQNGISFTGTTTNKKFDYDGTNPGTDQTYTGYRVAFDDGRNDDITTVGITSAATSGTYAFTFGHPFKQGDVPAGYSVTSDIVDFQCDPKNYWPDGSLCFAVFSGIASFTQNVERVITLKLGNYTDDIELVEGDLSALNPDININFGATYGNVSLSSLMGQTSTGRTVSGKIRNWLTGPVCSEFQYYGKAPNDDHLAGWMYVRIYRNGAIWWCPITENGWFRLASPGDRSYTLTFSGNSTNRYTGAIVHKHHTRWGAEYWYGTDPQITVKHNRDYLLSTKLIPPYDTGVGAADASVLNALTQTNVTPFHRGAYSSDMPSGGDDDAIGPLMQMHALHITNSCDARTYKATIAHSYKHGRYPIHYREENAAAVSHMQPVNLNQSIHYALSVNDSHSGIQFNAGNGTPTPAPTSAGFAQDEIWDVAHHPCPSYLAYLLTGNYFHLEETQFTAMICMLHLGSSRGGANLNYGQVQARAVAWGTRAMATAARVTPDSDTAMVTQYVTGLANKINSLLTTYSSPPYQNNLGVIHLTGIDLWASGNGRVDEPIAWQHHWISACFGWTSDMGLPFTAPQSANLVSLRNLSYAMPVGLRGGNDTTKWCARTMGQYSLPVGTPEVYPPTTWYPNWGAAFTAVNGTPNTNCADGGAISDGSAFAGVWHGGYNQQGSMALVMAIEHDYEGAQEAYDRIRGYSNYTTLMSGAKNQPKWVMAPRS
jgi:hypothetical protein